MGFLAAVVDKGRQNEILSILDYFIGQVKEEKGIGRAQVTSAVELTDKQKEQVTKKLLTTTRYVEFEMNYIVDPSLIGGMVIRIGDRVVDSSIKTQLYELKKQLLDVQLA
jgi:F-type H+-transporting ATPase subunit delta